MNRDIVKRDKILFGELDEDRYGPEFNGHRGGVRSFHMASLETIETLIAEDFINVDEAQNNSPTIEEFVKFAKQHPNDEVFFGGYAVHNSRDDYRVSIDVIKMFTSNIGSLADFAQEFHGADKFECYRVDVNNASRIKSGKSHMGGYYCRAWWD
jgi:hypothetical protein